ncbi:M16 family metallopeptidase [Streptomyces tubercidicus]|uniref:Peptidase M16 n=1 Tax=Streptomyces tubercidicus TaxID=47759 RepID=A0A640UJR0_9ACTN|nr:pitrilysin family protein [Streptomyces tubercidicus]WAU10455.1 insulinase family protein [Streptomyces tubercidicus]GFE35552.1 peptidase M16 [Streptomyces tubercidicus]
MTFATSAARIPVVTVVDPRLKTTSLCLGVGYGSRHDPPGCGGLAHMLEHLLMSAPVGTVGPLVQHLERLGGTANAETGLEQMLFYTQVAAEDAEEALDLLLRGVLTPEPDAATLDSERTAVLQELAAAEADPTDTVQDAFLAALFPDHPLGRPVGGTVPEIGRLDIDTVLGAHRSLFLPSPMVLTVIGPEIPRIPAEFAQAEYTAPAPRPEFPLGPVRAAEHAWPDEFSWVAVGGRSPSMSDDAGRQCYAVLANLMGADACSLLYRELRVSAGLAYAFQAWDRGYAESGAWRVLVGVESGNGAKAVDVVVRVLDELATDGPTDTDLDAARRRARMSLILDAETPLEHARLLAYRSLDRTSGWDMERELRLIADVTRDDIRAAAAHIRSGLVTVVRPEPR